MNDDPLLGKMDALLRKHRGTGEPAVPPSEPTPAPRWLPILTDVVERGTVIAAPPSLPATPGVPHTVRSDETAAPPAPAAMRVTPEPDAPIPLPPAQLDALIDTLANELAEELADRMKQSLKTKLRETLGASRSAHQPAGDIQP